MEEFAIKSYTERAQQAEQLGEVALKVRLEEMIGDETTHYEAVKLLLDGWSDTM
jgi:bacterioferritin